MNVLRFLVIFIMSFTHPVVKNWQSTHYIWDFGVISQCNKGMPMSAWDYFHTSPTYNVQAYRDLKSGDIIWIKAQFIHRFVQDILPTLNVPIALLIADGDESFPSNCHPEFDIENLLNHRNIIHVFAQNYDYHGTSLKISRFPIGMDYHTIAYKNINGGWGEKGSPVEQEQLLHNIISDLKPTNQRIKKAYVDFHLSDTMHGEFKRYLQFGEDRKSIFNRLKPTGLIDYGGFVKRSELWRRKGAYAFSISPHGNGLDCHRTWEDLILGCIVIVKTSSLDPLYEGLPVVIINDWSEITPNNMEKWLRQFGDALHNNSYREKLTHHYWFSKIEEVIGPYK